MKKNIVSMALSILLAGAIATCQAKQEQEIPGGVEYDIGEAGKPYAPGAIQADIESRDNANELFWRIQNKTGTDIRIASDVDFLHIPNGADGRLDRSKSFEMIVNGTKLNTQDHVIVLYTKNGVITMETTEKWDPKKGFGALSNGSGLGTGLGKTGFWGRRHGGWGHMQGMHQGKGRHGRGGHGHHQRGGYRGGHDWGKKRPVQ